MKRVLTIFLIVPYILFFYASNYLFAATSLIDQNIIDEGGTPSSSSVNNSIDTNNILGQSTADLRSGNVDMNTIPRVIVSVIETLLAIAGTVAIFSLIYHAVQMQINSGITGDSSGVDKAKKGMTGALIGFVIAIAAWFLVTRAVELLGAVS